MNFFVVNKYEIYGAVYKDKLSKKKPALLRGTITDSLSQTQCQCG